MRDQQAVASVRRLPISRGCGAQRPRLLWLSSDQARDGHDRRWAIDLDAELRAYTACDRQEASGKGCQPNRAVPPCRLQGVEVESYHGEKTIVILNAR